MVLLLASATDLELISITCTSLGDDERAAAAVGKTLSVARVRQRLAKALCVSLGFSRQRYQMADASTTAPMIYHLSSLRHETFFKMAKPKFQNSI